MECNIMKRRDFIKFLGLGSGAAAVAAVEVAESSELSASDDVNDNGYRETEHVRRYYRLASY